MANVKMPACAGKVVEVKYKAASPPVKLLRLCRNSEDVKSLPAANSEDARCRG